MQFKAARTARRAGMSVAVMLALGAMNAGNAAAAVVLDTYGPGGTFTAEANGVLGGANGGQISTALGFTLASTTTLGDIQAAINVAANTTGTMDLGVMADAAGIPSDSFLFHASVTNPSPDVHLTNLNWTLGPGKYWLAAVGQPGFAGGWHYGSFTQGGTMANTSFSFGWVTFPGPVVAARITTAVPEPETYALMLAGLGLLGLAARRRVAQR